MRRFLPLVLALCAAACHRPDTRQTAEQDAHDIAQVKAAQRMIPPAVPFAPQPVSFADLDAPATLTHIPAAVGKPGPTEGCGFVPSGAAPTGSARAADTIAAVRKFAVAKHGGQLEIFAADSGSPVGPAGLPAKYAGSGFALDLHQGDAIAPQRWHAAIAIRDSYERIVYFAAGELRCHG